MALKWHFREILWLSAGKQYIDNLMLDFMALGLKNFSNGRRKK